MSHQKDPKFPGMRWHPETGEAQVFNSAAEVPDGWLERHPNHKEDDRPAPEPKEAALPMTKDDVIAALDAGGVSYKKNAGHKALYALLVKSLKDHLTEAKVEFPDDATAPQLLALVPPAKD